jgi:hypothetical protein
VSQSDEKTGLVPDPVCRTQIGADATRWSRWEKSVRGFPPAVVVLGRKYRRHDEWAAFRDALLAAGDGSTPHSPRTYRKTEVEAVP